MYKVLVFVICFFINANIVESWWTTLRRGGRNVCTRYNLRTHKYYEDCGFWSWQACTKYRWEQYSYTECCPGYSNDNHLSTCPYPICDGKIKDRACKIQYTNDAIIYRSSTNIQGRAEHNSGGHCASPNICSNCNDGFYVDGPYCRICPRIAHCKHRRCTNIYDNHCEYCDGEYVDKKYWRAYTRHRDAAGRDDPHYKNCIQACSWRKDSTRCYPGTCTNEIAKSCKCLGGFGGHHCDEIRNGSTISSAIAKLSSSTNSIADPVETPENLNNPIPGDTKWTNEVLLDTAYLEVMAVFKVNDTPPKPDKDGRNHFVTEFKYGILRGEMRLTLIRDTNSTILPIVKKCRVNKALPTNDAYHCKEEKVDFGQWNSFLPFQHDDMVFFSFEIVNGGHLKYIDRDKYPENPERAPRELVNLKGKTVFRQFLIQWDLIDPEQDCIKQYQLNCTSPPVSVPDITTNSSIIIQWNGWIDDLAGIGKYEYEVFELGNDGTSLSEDQGSKITEGKNISSSDYSSQFQVKSPGMYSVIFTAVDKAGNEKTARTLFFYDDSSKVELVPGQTSSVKQATKATNYVWVDVNNPTLDVQWPKRFKNQRHYKQLWLETVQPRVHVDAEYDDHYGKRETTTVPHSQGIVRFETKLDVLSPNISQQQSFVSTANVIDESTSLSVRWNDGDRLDVTVRAFDIFDVYVDDMVTVYRDTSPPEIENLWLSRGDRVNISVHSIKDFTKMTIEWNAFDYHSGIDNLEWRLYDNYTKTDVIHGHANLHSQGDTKNLTECQNKYGNAPRGPSCYCTSFHGCFHKHFFVKPDIVKGAGLIAGMDKGVHDSDYYIEVTVVNQAMLKTVVVKKITIDVSPPHEGSVHDGIRGEPEIDYQQDLHIDAHWEGFFDRESGVDFYQYVFSDHCFTNDEFKNSTQTTETYTTHTSYDAPSEGTYYISVVAVNRAEENSNVVCSDGVTIMTTIPHITNFVLEGARTKPRIVEDTTGALWLLDNKLQRHLIENSTVSCRTPDLMENITVLPKMNTISSFDQTWCDSFNSINILAVVRKTSQFKMNWTPVMDKNLIHDYEIGLSSTPNSIAPDVVPFRSSKHHNHFRLNHPDVPDGKEFYVIVKSISKSGTEGLQSIGPCIIDTTRPLFTGGNIDVNLENEYLIANWSANAFTDVDDPYPMQYQYAVGHQQYTYDIQSFKSLQYGGSCRRTSSYLCTALPIKKLKWSLHGHHDYFFTIKATNLAGLSARQTSLPYRHDVQLPPQGIVLDIPISYNRMKESKDIEDIDFTTDYHSLAISWSGFVHPHQTVSFRACIGFKPKLCDVSAMTKLNTTNESYVFSSLTLTAFKKYFVTLEASSTAGNVKVSSDGIRVLDIHTNLTGIVVKDGTNCSDSPTLLRSHHSQDTRPQCTDDTNYQTSTSTLHAYWIIPDVFEPYIRDSYIKIEERLVDDVWIQFKDFDYVGRHRFVSLNGLDLKPGKSYRAVVKFCAEDLCFPSVYSDGVTVITNPPSTGNVSVLMTKSANLSEQISVRFDKMMDPDVNDPRESRDMIESYEWAIGDNVGIHTVWNQVDNFTTVGDEISFVVQLNNSIDFSKCRKIYIRGYNKAGVWSTVSKEIKKCNIDDGNSLIIPNIVIDAIGKQEFSIDGNIRDGYGHDIFLEKNNRWEQPDVDYTPYKNILSATWPLLRHSNYSWAVINAENLDVTSYYKDEAKLQLKDPSSHPDAIKWGQTAKEYINVIFNTKEELEHGKRYLICIHAPKRTVKYEKWTEVFDEVNTCSDGVTVDLTPPTPGHVWIGIDPAKKYQSSSSDMFISWDSFTDVEEYNMAVHNSGIKEYHVGIGSTRGGTDIVAYKNVGVVNHYTFHGLVLQNGHEYYTTVKAYDFSTRSSTADSHPVKIDNTPPETSEQPIKINGRHLSELSEINACWRDVFIDTESGIDHYLWAIGSHPGHDDIIPFTKTTLDCGVSAEDKKIDFHEGHAYFITVKAVNRANLITTASSWAYVYDMSPPIAGHVYDGSMESTFSYMKDLDYQTNTKTLSNYWEGFHDPHSTIKTYYVNIGTCPDCEDLLGNQDIGISNNFTLCHIHLGSGIRYYTTVTACNTADMCTSVTSDGVVIDNSPPTQGTVQDGVEVYDVEYQSLRDYVSAKWYGFTDPQSEIDRYSWRAGTKPGSDDLVTSTHLPITDILVDPDLSRKLPTGKRIYVTIKAYNKAGLSTEATSNGFYIDESPPVIKQKPTLSTELGSVKEYSIVFRSTIRITWNVEDKESFIQRQYLSITSHKGGEFNATSTELDGIVREYTFSRLDLHDGGNYTIKLIVCNGAKICIEDASHGITVDSSPPTPGMFAIKTDHAANLHRHVNGWMTWSRYKLWLSWLGFTDLHTGIDKYYVSLGSQYMWDDLNKITGSPQEFLHNQSGVDKQDEGFVQTFEVATKNLAKFEHVFVSVWSVNKVGLSSRMIHSQFKLVPGGSLELIRRCSAITCLGHCVCAAQGQRCSINAKTCKDVTKANPNNLLGVYDITNVAPTSAFKDVKYSPSNVALAAKWQIVQAQGLRPVWYEWTAGLTIKDDPEGVFDNLEEDVWHHAGQSNQVILNLRRGKELKESPVSYSMFIRAWYDTDTYADFKTDGILVLSTPLAKRKLKGAAVVEQVPRHWKKDVDFIRPGSPFTVRWTNVFIKDFQIMDKFKVYLSTFPGGHDVHVVEADLPGTMTSYNISRVPLLPGIVYYSNVVGYSLSGIHSTVTSDGVMVDSVPPVSGTVYDGIGVHDIDYHNSSGTVAASWHGFSDRDSGLTHYMWCVKSKKATQGCDIRDWENVGIHRSVSRQLNSSVISTGTEIESQVYAVDLIGHSSKTTRSNGLIIDTTHPEPTRMEHLDINIAQNPSFEETISDVITWENISTVNFCMNMDNVQPLHWNTTTGSCNGVLKSDKNVAMDGRSFLFLEGEISQMLENLIHGELYRVTFVSSHPPLLGAVLANKEGYVVLGDRKHVFIVYTKQDKHGNRPKDVHWHHHTFYFRSNSDTETIRFGSMTGHTGILLDHIQVQQVVIHDHDDNEAKGKHIHAHIVTVHQWSSVHASWSFMDPESPIVDYMWAIGYTEGSTEVQGFTSVGLSNFAYNYNVSLAHTSVIHITVIATNAAGLMREAHAGDLLVDLTPPEILFVSDGIGSDIDAQTSDEISANWNVNDPESGLEVCDWAVGYQPYGNEIQAFQKLPRGVNMISKIFPTSKISRQMVHITIRCRNKAGLQSSLSSDGVKISNLPPETTNAEVQILPHSLTENNCRNGYQGDTSKLQVKWTGFEDIAGLDSYKLKFESGDNSIAVSKSILAEDQDMSYCILYGLDMSKGNYTASVAAVNKMYLRSVSVKNGVFVSSVWPQVTENPNLKMSMENRTVTLSWKDHFSSEEPIFYEVSAGTTLGGADIIQWQETKNDFLEFAIPPKIKSTENLSAYICVRGIYANGMAELLNTRIKF